MSNISRKAIAVAGITAAALATTMASPAVANKSTVKTAQGNMVNIEQVGGSAVSGTDTYQFNTVAAQALFSNTQTSGPVVTCNGSAANCATTNQPAAAPTAPAPSAQQLRQSANSQQCTFLDGGILSGQTYTQSVTVRGRNGSGNWVYTWTYTIAAPVNAVEAFTAWDLVDADSELGSLEIGAEIAGQSAQLKDGVTKYSFGLSNSDGTSRIGDLRMKVTNSADEVIYDSVVAHTVATNSAAVPVDFGFVANAGKNGALELVRDGGARALLNNDGFKGNDNGGSDGSALALATMTAVELTDLAADDYHVTVSGTVKGNAAAGTTGTSPFEVESDLTVLTPGCSSTS